MRDCPCFSGKLYKDCCLPYHNGTIPENALILMRSRYAAYALGLVKYIIETTHPKNRSFPNDQKLWENEILHFCQTTKFLGLEILEFIPGEKESFVTFKAVLERGNKDASFIEKSKFLKENDRWLYMNCLSCL